MEIKVKPFNSFELSVGGQELGVFTKISEWEGFVKYQGAQGVIIAARPDSSFVDKLFNDLFNAPIPETSVVAIKALGPVVPALFGNAPPDIKSLRIDGLQKALERIVGLNPITEEGKALAEIAKEALDRYGQA